MTQLLGDVELVTKQELEAALEAVVIPESGIDDKISKTKEEVEKDLATQKEVIDSDIDLLKSRINAEATARTNADAALDDKIKDEASIRETSDNALQTRIEREEGVRKSADDQIIALIDAEKTARDAADVTLQQGIESLSVKIDPALSELTELVAKEETARKTADETLTAAVDAVKTGLDNESADREAADKALDKRIDDLKNTSNRSFEDTVFAARLDNLPLAQITVENKDKTISVGDVLASVSSEYLPKIPVTFSMVSVVAADDGSDAYAYLSLRLDASGNVVVINKSILNTVFEGNINSATVMYIIKE